MIKVFNLIKTYKNNNVLNIDFFNFEKGKSYLLVGSNGSGKSTLLKCILGINNINNGKIEINTKNIGYIPERFYFPEFCSIEKFLNSILNIYNKMENNHLIYYYCQLFSLNETTFISKLSKGMMQKVLIIQSLIHDADLFIMDEPLNGLDNYSQKLFFRIIDDLKLNNKTIIIATHYPQFYNNNYDYILKIDNKEIIYENN